MFLNLGESGALDELLSERNNRLTIDVGDDTDLQRVLEQMQWAMDTAGQTADKAARACWYAASQALQTPDMQQAAGLAGAQEAPAPEDGAVN